MTLLSTLLHATHFRNPFLRTLLPSIGTAFGIQAAFAVPSILFQTERFYDLSGSLTYLSCTALSLYLPTIRARAAAAAAGQAIPAYPSLFKAVAGVAHAGLNWRQVLLSTFVTIWAARLGTYLFKRITDDQGKDSRFDNIRGSAAKFGGAFAAQATWVSLCLLPVMALNSMPQSTFAALGAFGLTDLIGVALYVGGISIEVLADRQKSQWVAEKKEGKHHEPFLSRGLWDKSRHPNYFGEATLWTGIATVSAGVLSSGAGLSAMGLGSGILPTLVALSMAGVSPAFVSFLLFKVSGIPMTEKSHDKKYGDNKDYQKWKRETPVFFPNFFK